MHTSETLTLLAIETSCDDTAAAIVRYDGADLDVLSSVVSSQIALHAQYGGVVPNLAAREHSNNIVPVLENALHTAGVTKNDIDAIAVTRGPGLIPALLVGVSAAKTLALVWDKPLIGIHHIEGHIYANFLSSRNDQFPISNFQTNSKSDSKIENLQSEISDLQLFPLLALVVSGGHTQLVLMRDHFEYEIIGETQDDAAGEAFDKVARMLGLPYPGGPAIALRANNFRLKIEDFRLDNKSEIPDREISAINNLQSAITLPRPMIHSDDYNFSFSGLKTAVLYLVKENEARKSDDAFIDAVAYEFQEAVVDVLVTKTKKAIAEYRPKTVVIAGGVSANVRLRESLAQSISAHNLEASLPSDRVTFLTPEFRYSVDNAGMIGIAAAFRLARLTPIERDALKTNALSLDPDANLPLGNS